MTCDKCDKKDYKIKSIQDVDVDDLASTPDFFLATRTVTELSSGATKEDIVKVPGARVMPTGNLANVTAIITNNGSLDIPENQVRGGYIDVQPGGNIVRLADENNPAMFLMISNYTNGKVLIQTTGFLNIPAGHQYIVGQQYYLGELGEPTTDETVTGKKLFKAIDDFTLNVNGEF